MPLPMVHLAVANEVHKNLKLENVDDFFLGNIAPDAIHMRENTTQMDKSITHLYFKDFDDIMRMNNDIKIFYLKELNNSDSKHNHFTLGYCSHLITDYYWFKTIFKLFENRLPKEINDNEIRSSYYFDTDHIDSKIYYWSEWTTKVMDELKKAKSHSNKFLSKDEINKWKERTLNWFSDGRLDPKKETKYIKYEEINNFIEETTKEVTRIIKDLLGEGNTKL